MSTAFDTAVRVRQDHTPWAFIDLEQFAHDVAGNEEHIYSPTGNVNLGPSFVEIRCQEHLDIVTRFWWSIHWIGADGKPKSAGASRLDLLLWRAAEIEMQAQAQAEMNRETNGTVT